MVLLFASSDLIFVINNIQLSERKENVGLKVEIESCIYKNVFSDVKIQGL